MKKILPFLVLILLILSSLVSLRYLPSVMQKPLATSNTPIDDFADVAKRIQDLPTTQKTTSQVTFLSVGDISLSRGIAYAIDKNKDVNFPFRKVQDLLKSTDFNFGNLETPFSSSDKYTAKSTLVFNAPKKNIEGLVNNNFVVVSTANNHALDQSLDGIIQTRTWLLENNILPVGTGENLEEAWLPATVTRKGITIGFSAASYASVNDGGKTINDHVARIEDVSNLKSSILNLKFHSDFTVVSMHAGSEYTRKPNPDQVQFAHAAIDNGADMVIGHHPHWVQDKEVYCSSTKKSRTIAFKSPLALTDEEKNMGCKPIYYSLGNFIFDQGWSPETTQGLALKITLRKSADCHTASINGNDYSTLNPTQEVEIPASVGMTQENCPPQLQGSSSPASLVSIEEIPIKIENNCCAKIDK